MFDANSKTPKESAPRAFGETAPQCGRAPWRERTVLHCDEAIVPRSRIVKVQAQRLSLMPEGLEEGLVSQDLADLLDFIFADIN